MSNLWIPIEKELPEVAKPVLVTINDDDDLRWVSFARRCSDGTWIYVEDGEPMDSDFKIIAWLKVPKPYTGDIK